MIRRCSVFVLFALTLGVGCNKDTGGGATRDTQFSLSGPTTATTIRQGADATAELTLNPGKNFKETVKLKAAPQDNAIKFVKFSEDSPALDGSNKKTVVLTVSAAADASTENHVVRVTATPEKGDAVTLEIKFDVKQK